MTPKQEIAIRKHGEQLNSIFNTKLDPMVLCKKLRRIEGAAHKLAEDCCNQLSMESLEFDKRYAHIKDRVSNLLGDTWGSIGAEYGVEINLYPRGYSLKINDAYMIEKNLTLYRDLRGYGILAPEFGRDGK
jgi:hypothetical protein